MSGNEIDLLLEQYRDLQAQKETQTKLKDEDPELNKWGQKLLKLDEMAQKISSIMAERSNTFGIGDITDKQNELKEQMKAEWADPTKKTYKSTIGTVTLRTTKSLIIDSVKKVVDVLVKNDKTEECIATFKLAEVSKLVKADLLEDAVHYEEKKSISIKLAEEK